MKYQEIQDQKHEILGNTLLKYFYATLVRLEFFIDWVLNYFTLFTGMYEMSNFMKTNENKCYQKWIFFF
jgi:hypothetical protein